MGAQRPIACSALSGIYPPTPAVHAQAAEWPLPTQFRHRSVCLVIEEAGVRHQLCPTERSFIV